LLRHEGGVYAGRGFEYCTEGQDWKDRRSPGEVGGNCARGKTTGLGRCP